MNPATRHPLFRRIFPGFPNLPDIPGTGWIGPDDAEPLHEPHSPARTRFPRLFFNLPCLIMCSVLSLAKLEAESIPALSTPIADGDFEAAAKTLSAAPWTMEQAWRESPEDGLRRATVRLGWAPDAIWVLADLPDDHIESQSTAHRQPMWELGDVFEIFIGRSRSPLYLELHASPNNHRLHLRWTTEDMALVRSKKKQADDLQQDPADFQSWVRRMASGKGWQVLARLPASLWPDARAFRAGQKFALSFSRYDCGPGGQPKILSSTSPHRELNFHRRHEWRTAALTPAR